MLQVNNVDVFYGHAQALSEINLQVRQGQITAMVGSNGAGKTTLMKCLSGIVKPSKGSIFFEGKSIAGLSPAQIVKLGVIQVPEGRKLFPSLTIQENLEMGSTQQHAKEKRAETLKYVYELFPLLRERKAQLAVTLSGGEQQMLAFGRALMGLPKVLLLDEPSVGLAPLVVRSLFETIKKLHERGVTIFLVEQNLRASLNLSQWGYVIENGCVVLEGTSAKLLSDARTIKAYFGTEKNL